MSLYTTYIKPIPNISNISNSITLHNISANDKTNIFSSPTYDITDLRYIKFNGMLPYSAIYGHESGNIGKTGVSEASDSISEEYLPYNAFLYSNAFVKWKANGTSSYIQYNFFEDKIIYKYQIDCSLLDNYNESPNSWIFQGYDENTLSWVDLDTQASIVFSATTPIKEFNIPNPINKYKKYRLNIFNNNGNTSYLSINKLKLYEIYDSLDADNKIIIELTEDNTLYIYLKNNNDITIYKLNSFYTINIDNIDLLNNKTITLYFNFDNSGNFKIDYKTIKTPIFDSNIYPICSFDISNGKLFNLRKAVKYNDFSWHEVMSFKYPQLIFDGNIVQKHISNVNNILYFLDVRTSNIKNIAHNPILDNWVSKSNLPTHSDKRSINALKTSIYPLIMGTNWQTREYNTITDNWVDKTSTTHFTYATRYNMENDNNFNIHSINCYNSNTSAKIHRIFTPITDLWESRANTITNKTYSSTTCYYNYIFHIAGILTNANTLYNNERYNIFTDAWDSKQNSPISGHFVNDSRLLVNNTIYMFPVYYLNYIIKYLINDDSYMTTNIIQDISFITATIYENDIYCQRDSQTSNYLYIFTFDPNQIQ